MFPYSIVIFSWKWSIHSLLFPLVIYFCYRVLGNLHEHIFCSFMFLGCYENVNRVSTALQFPYWQTHTFQLLDWMLYQMECQERMSTKPMFRKSIIFVKFSTQELPHDCIALLKRFCPLCRIEYEPVNYIDFQPIRL